MPFPQTVFFVQAYTNINIHKFIGFYFLYDRRVEEFEFSRNTYFFRKAEKVSDSASEGAVMQKASITVEAVICIPLFFYAALCLIWMLEIRTIQTVIRCGMQETGKKLAESAYQSDILISSQIETMLVSSIGAERLDRSIVVQGANGLHCEKSYSIHGIGIYELCVEYRMKLPFPFFKTGLMTYKEEMRIKGWTGYAKELFEDNSSQQMVYITETGLVYHLDYHCNYLEPSIRKVSNEVLGDLRNKDGEKYGKCPLCTSKNTSSMQIYITNYGNRYHYSSACPGLKRKIYTVPISEVKGKAACSKCGK